MSVTPPLFFGNTKRTSIKDNGNRNDDSRPPSSGNSDSFSKSSLAHRQSPVNEKEELQPLSQQCCSPPPLLYIPVAAQKVTHLHGPPELKRFPSPSNLPKEFSLAKKATQMKKDDSVIIVSNKRNHCKNVDGYPQNSISVKCDASKETIPTRTSQTSNEVTTDLSRSFVSSNKGVSCLERPPVSKKKASSGFHVVGCPTRFRGMLEDFSCVIHRQPNPSAIAVDEKTEKGSSDRLFGNVKEQQFVMSYSPPLLRHVLNIKQQNQNRLLSPPQLTPVTSRMGSPSFLTENSSTSDIYLNSTKPSIHRIVSSDLNVSRPELSHESSPSPPTLTPVTPNFSHSTNKHLESQYQSTPSPPKLSSMMPNIFCPRTLAAAKPWMPVLDRVSVKSSVGHSDAMHKESKVVGYPCYPSAQSQNLFEQKEPKTRGIPSSLIVGSRTSYHSRFHPYTNNPMVPHSSIPPVFSFGPTTHSARSTECFSSPNIVKQVFVDRPLTSTKFVTQKAENIQRESVPLVLDDRSSNCMINNDQHSSYFFPLMDKTPLSDLYENSAYVEMESINRTEVQSTTNSARKTFQLTNKGETEPITSTMKQQSFVLLSDNSCVVKGNKCASTTHSFEFDSTKDSLQNSNVVTKTTSVPEASSEKVVTIDLIRNDVLNEAGEKPKEKLQCYDNRKCEESHGSDNNLNLPSNSERVLGKEIDSKNKSVKNKEVIKRNLKNKIRSSSSQKHIVGSSLNCNTQKRDNFSDCEERHVSVPTFFPNEEEFKDPIKYLEGVVQKAQNQGICVVVPPPTWKVGSHFFVSVYK